MPFADNNQKFVQLRKNYPYFIYDSYHFLFTDNSLDIEFTFNLAGKYIFKPTIHIPFRDFFNLKKLPAAVLENIIFHIGMVEMLSYWKAACPPLVIVKPFKLNEEQILWWKNLYFSGLGEFFYLNGISTSVETFMDIRSESTAELTTYTLPLENSYIVPVGGGKDSVVTLELLKNKYPVTPIVINPRKATTQCILEAGYSEDQTIEIFRTIDPLLLELNAQGFLNGHTPFSALLAFVSLLAGALSGKKNIALSNEASANETTVIGQNINHQYSKSYSFEKDFRQYVSAFINGDLNYFSFLRPLHEIQIAYLFSQMTKYFPVFKSCNVGSKEDIWCCNCPKCLFSFIILSPFIGKEELENIFGENLFDKAYLLAVFNQLTGVNPVKPFECIGTVEEVNIALCMTVDKYKEKLPFLLKAYTETPEFIRYKNISPDIIMNKFDEEHFVSLADFDLIKQTISC